MTQSTRSGDLEARIVAQAALLLLAILALLYLWLLSPSLPPDGGAPTAVPVLQQPAPDDRFRSNPG